MSKPSTRSPKGSKAVASKRASAVPSFLPSFEARTSINSAVDADVLAVFQDSGNKPVSPSGSYSELIQKFRKTEAFNGRAGAVQFVRFGGADFAESVAFVGMGIATEVTEEKVRQAGASVYAKLSAEKVKTVAIHVDTILEVRGLKAEISQQRLVRAFCEGLILSAYRFDKHKAKPQKGTATETYTGPAKIILLTRDKSTKTQLDNEIAQIEAIGQSVTVTRDWSNEPSNIGTPEFYANEARRLGREYGLTVRVLNERDCKREGMELLLAVGQGAERESRVVVIEYNPRGVKNPKTIAYVGKGVTFDSGGISIKPSMKMEDMKHDMTGAATVMGAVMLAAQWKAPNRVIGVMAFVENMPDGNAIQPGNVINTRAGKTVEVINTDAEGRLILADVLDYAQDMKPDAVINVATLTGAVVVALGKHCCGLMGNDDGLMDALRRTGEANGERMWQLPLFDEYLEDLKSDYADIKNSANHPAGGTIRGGIFLKQFIRKGVSWAHMDIAATAYDMGHVNYYPKRGASGMHVRTLAQFAMDY
ncbi:MAG: leucyl aminopeptidase [Bdellovibrionia bacterium]